MVNLSSTWSKMVRIVALMMLLVKKLKTKIKQRKLITTDEVTTTLITTTMIQESRMTLVKLVQQRHFRECKWLKLMKGKDNDSRVLSRKCRISQLDPFIDEPDAIRVGGRLQNSHISDDCKHPILLPRKGKVSDLIINHCHSKVAHGSRGFTLNKI